jgi:succinate dehydrogenase / fumarate reductase cytochrome b subunit
MRWGGVIIGTFVVYHLLHFTIGPEWVHGEFVHGEAYQNVVYGFQNPLVSGFYVLALVMVTFHVYHGLWSAFQTVGANHPKYNPFRRPLALVLALLLLLGFLTVPVGVMAGILTI